MALTLRSPALGLAWQLWERHRLGISLLGAYLLALIAVANFVPAAYFSQISVFMSAMFFGFGLLYLMGVFTYPDADVAATVSGYPPYLLTLPVRTRDLVFWPMLYGTITVAAGWIVLAEWVVLPRGGIVGIWWPAAMLAAILACLQAIFWSPVGLPYMRLVLSLAVIPLLMTIGFTAGQNGTPAAALTAFFLCIVPVAYAIAYNGVARARRGDSPEYAWFPERAPHPEVVEVVDGQKAALRTWKPFKTGSVAQLWVEWKRNGIIFPLMTIGVCLLYTIPVFLVKETAPLSPHAEWAQSFAAGRNGPLPNPGLGGVELNVWVKTYLLSFLMMTVFFGSIIGGGLRKGDTRKKDLSLHLFLATRPMTDLEMVWIKLKAAAMSSLAAWGVMTLFIILWLMAPGKEGGRTAPFLLLAWEYVTPEGILLFALCLFGLFAWTWRNQVVTLFVDLSGRAWLVTGYPIFMFIVMTAAVINGTKYISEDAHSLHPHNWQAISFWAGVILIVLKYALAVWSVQKLRQHQLIKPDALAKLIGAWCLTTFAVFGLLILLRAQVPACAAFLGQPDITPALTTQNLALFAIMFVPFNRLALAPLSLAWNRHRLQMYMRVEGNPSVGAL
jgi:hypothetical protein